MIQCKLNYNWIYTESLLNLHWIYTEYNKEEVWTMYGQTMINYNIFKLKWDSKFSPEENSLLNPDGDFILNVSQPINKILCLPLMKS